MDRVRLEFRSDAMIEDSDGRLYLVLHGENDNVQNSEFKSPFDPHRVNGIDDGDPHFV
jgi:hypothetical protein